MKARVKSFEAIKEWFRDHGIHPSTHKSINLSLGNIDFISDMREHCGKIIEVIDYDGWNDFHYTQTGGYNWSWHKDWLEIIDIDDEANTPKGATVKAYGLIKEWFYENCDDVFIDENGTEGVCHDGFIIYFSDLMESFCLKEITVTKIEDDSTYHYDCGLYLWHKDWLVFPEEAEKVEEPEESKEESKKPNKYIESIRLDMEKKMQSIAKELCQNAEERRRLEEELEEIREAYTKLGE